MRHTTLLLAGIVAVTACRTAGVGAGDSYYADMRSGAGAALGRITIERDSAGAVHMSGDLAGLAPGAHGIHFHQTGRCDAPEFTTAGGHFNPGGRQHGLENPAGPHAGDWPNLAVTAAGTARVNLATNRVSLDANPATGILDADGTAVVIHAAADDQRTDPSGNSGARFACGVITQR